MPAPTEIEILAMPLGRERLVLHRVAFDAAAFGMAAYELAGMVCPPHIARSVRKRQAEYFHGRLVARAALAAIGAPAGAIGSTRDGAPAWPDGVIGSISHCNHLAIAAAVSGSSLRGLGIDVERVIDAAQQDSILALVVDSREQALLRTLEGAGGLPFRAALTLAFSAKESFYKAVSAVAGRVLEFHAIQITRIDHDGAGGRVQFLTMEAISGDWPAGRCGHIDYLVLPGGELLTAFGW